MKDLKKKILKKVDQNTKSIQYGTWVFGFGLLVALVASFMAAFGDLSSTGTKITTGLLITVGIIVGALNITNKESVAFMISSIIVVMLVGPFLANIIQTFGIAGSTAQLFGEIFKNLVGLIVPAALIVAFKTLFSTAKDE